MSKNTGLDSEVLEELSIAQYCTLANTDFSVLELSRGFSAITGRDLTSDYNSEASLANWIHPSDHAEVFAEKHECARNGVPWRLEYRLKGIGDQWISVVDAGKAYSDEQHSLLFRGCIQQIYIAKKEARQRELLSLFPNSNPSPIFSCDYSGRPLFANKSAHSIAKELGCSAFDLLPENLYEVIQRCIADGTASLTAEKSVGGLWFQWFLCAMPDADLIHLYGKDVSKSRIEYAEYMENELRRAKAILDFHPHFIGMGRLDGRGIYINPAGLRMRGLPEDTDVTQLSPVDFFPKDEAERIIEKMIPLAIEAGEWSAELNVLQPDGSTIPVQATIGVIYDRENNPMDCSFILADKRPQKAVEAELSRQKYKAVQAAKAKGEFLANMSHEIRTPLNAVIGYSELLLETSLNEEQQHAAQSITESGKLLLSLINNVLDVSKLDTEHLTLERVPLELDHLVRGVCDIIGMSMCDPDGKVEVKYRYPEGCPKWFLGDSTRIRQILLNLMGNAAKFTHEGEVELRIDKIEPKGVGGLQTVTMTVRDTGIGIPIEDQANIFDAFSQADSSITRKFGGTGLGLTITRKLIDLFDGHIEVKSEVGKGSEFTFSLALELAAPELSNEELPVPKLAPGAIPDRQISLLLVEDNEQNQQLMHAILHRYGISYDLARNGLEAVEMASGGKYDICLMDLNMPEMGGIEAVRIIRQELQLELPIIALTAAVLSREEKQCKDVGMNAFLAKPVRAKELVAVIDQFVNK